MSLGVIIAMGLMVIFASAFVLNIVDFLTYATLTILQERRYRLMSDPTKKSRRELYYEKNTRKEKEAVKTGTKDHSEIYYK